MGKNNSYTDEEILEGLELHMVEGLKSKYTFHDPMTWNGCLKRMDKDKDFKRKVHTIVNRANTAWEEVGLKALTEDNKDFNVALYKMFVGNKRPFLTHEVLELESRIERLEDGKSKD